MGAKKENLKNQVVLIDIVAEVFTGRFDAPTQVALREAATGRVRLVDFFLDGTFPQTA